MESTTKTMVQPAQAARTFTQEDVNKIVSERLTRERLKLAGAEQPQEEALSQREQELTARENRLSCQEILRNRQLPDGLLEILDTSDFQVFVKKLELLLELCPYLEHNAPLPPTFSILTEDNPQEYWDDPVHAAFERKD